MQPVFRFSFSLHSLHFPIWFPVLSLTLSFPTTPLSPMSSTNPDLVLGAGRERVRVLTHYWDRVKAEPHRNEENGRNNMILGRFCWKESEACFCSLEFLQVFWFWAVWWTKNILIGANCTAMGGGRPSQAGQQPERALLAGTHLQALGGCPHQVHAKPSIPQHF